MWIEPNNMEYRKGKGNGEILADLIICNRGTEKELGPGKKQRRPKQCIRLHFT